MSVPQKEVDSRQNTFRMMTGLFSPRDSEADDRPHARTWSLVLSSPSLFFFSRFTSSLSLVPSSLSSPRRVWPESKVEMEELVEAARSSWFTRCHVYTGLSSLIVAVWGITLALLARAQMPASPRVGVALSAGGVSGVVNHICTLSALDELSPSFTQLGSNAILSTASAGSIAQNLYTNSPTLWVPHVSDLQAMNTTQLSAIDVPDGQKGVNDAGRLFDLFANAAECSSCMRRRSPPTPEAAAFACEWCTAFRHGFLLCLIRGNPIWDCFLGLFSEYYDYDVATSKAGPWPTIVSASIFNQPERLTGDVDNGGVPQVPTPGFDENSAMIFTHVPPNKGHGSVELSNDNFRMLGQGVRTLGPLFRTQAYNAKLVNSLSASSSFLGINYFFNDANGEDCHSLFDYLIGFEPGSLPSVALQSMYISQMRLIGSWKRGFFSLFQSRRQRTAVVSDAALADHGAMVGLLRQKVPNIIAFMTSSAPYSRVNSPAMFFGANPWSSGDEPCWHFWTRLPNNTMQVFDSALWPQVDAALRDTSGNNSIVLTNVQVLANPYLGVQSYTLDSLYLQGWNVLDSFTTRMTPWNSISQNLSLGWPSVPSVTPPELDVNMLCALFQHKVQVNSAHFQSAFEQALAA